MAIKSVESDTTGAALQASPQAAVRVAPAAHPPLVPPIVQHVEDTGIEPGFIADLILKIVYYHSIIPAGKIAEVLRLPFSEVVDGLIEELKSHHFIGVLGTDSPLRVAYKYALTDKGLSKVHDLLRRSTYAGPCPVTLEDYTYMVSHQRVRDAEVTREKVEQAFSRMVLAPHVLEQLGPAIYSGEPLFIHGPSGNGKTMMAEIATTCLGGDVYIPHALLVEGEIIRVFDAEFHQEVDDPNPHVDRRWVRSKRPIVIAGGELTLQSLDLLYSPRSKVYEAPLQMKANCGMFVIDDFGRQQCAAAALLNRWIVPLEKHVDYLNLSTGTKITVPFEELIVFATNLDPRDLVDDAFRRRMQYKIEVPPPTPDQFKEIFKRDAAARGITYREEAFDYLFTQYYEKTGRQLRACHPRDLLNHLLSAAHYNKVKPWLSKELLDFACRTYFGSLS
jgi:predicted ATPase with chaperone activity